MVVSLAVSLLLVAGMQVFKTALASNQLLTIVGGYLASLVFIFVLTAISNLQMNLFGKHFQTKTLEGSSFRMIHLYGDRTWYS